MLLSTIVDLFRGGLFALAHWFGGSFGAAIVVAARGAPRRDAAVEPASHAPASGPRGARCARWRRSWRRSRSAMRGQPRSVGRRDAAVCTSSTAFRCSIAASLVDSLLLFPPAAALYSAMRAVPRGVGRLPVDDRSRHAGSRARRRRRARIGRYRLGGGKLGRVGGARRNWLRSIGAVITFAILSHISAGVALYSLTNSVLGGAEQALARRMLRHEAR